MKPMCTGDILLGMKDKNIFGIEQRGFPLLHCDVNDYITHECKDCAECGNCPESGGMFGSSFDPQMMLSCLYEYNTTISLFILDPVERMAIEIHE